MSAAMKRSRCGFGLASGLVFIGLAAFGCVMPVIENETVTTAQEEELASIDEVQKSFDNTAPVARAGDDVDAVPGDEITLNATESSDVDRDRLSYVWTQVSGSPVVEFDNSVFSSITTFRVPADLEESTTLVFSVAVIDGFAVDFDEVRVRVDVDEE